MFSLPEMPTSTSEWFAAYASLSATLMLVRSMANELLPADIRSYIHSIFRYLFGSSLSLSHDLVLVFEEYSGMARNQVYDAAEIYLRTKINPSMDRLMVSKTPKDKSFAVMFDKGEEIKDSFERINLKWRFTCHPKSDAYSAEKTYFELRFDKKYKEKIMADYLPYVVYKAECIKKKEQVVKLYHCDCPTNYDDENGGGNGVWGYINLEHPASFDTLAMDPELKKMITDDLDRFLERKDFYRKVGKAWKRGYLLHGPPGTGKSSLIAAMANYLNFDIYDLDLSTIYSNSDLRHTLLSTTNRSILVIEDIDCNPEVQDRQATDVNDSDAPTKLTLSGILNSFDGLWSSTGDERIIVFTTNHKEKLDPALLRPGRMDMHIHLSYCNVDGFRILASNYLGINGHPLFEEIEGLIKSKNTTPAEIAEEMMRSYSADVALDGLVKSLRRKNDEATEEDTKNDQSRIEDEDSKTLKNDNNVDLDDDHENDIKLNKSKEKRKKCKRARNRRR